MGGWCVPVTVVGTGDANTYELSFLPRKRRSHSGRQEGHMLREGETRHLAQPGDSREDVILEEGTPYTETTSGAREGTHAGSKFFHLEREHRTAWGLLVATSDLQSLEQRVAW